MFDSLSLVLSTLRERLLFLENCFLYITPEEIGEVCPLPVRVYATR